MVGMLSCMSGVSTAVFVIASASGILKMCITASERFGAIGTGCKQSLLKSYNYTAALQWPNNVMKLCPSFQLEQPSDI